MRVLIIFLLFLLASGCGKKEDVSQKEVLNLSFGSQVRTLDPRLGGEHPTSHLIRMLFDGLIRRDEQGNLAPATAEKYTVSEDFKTYTFILRKTFWNDGMPVTAYDFEYAWKKCLDPNTVSHGAHNFYFIKNAKLSVEGKIPVSEVGVTALDSYTFQVELEYPVPYVFDVLDSTFFYPIPKHLDETDPSWIYRTDQSFVSNGPFNLKKWKQGECVTVEKSPSYWDQKNVYLSEIRISFLEDGMTQLYMYEKNQLDWIGDPVSKIPPEVLENLRKDGTCSYVASPRVFWYFLNSETFPFNNKKMRQAFSYAMDRNEIVEYILGGNALPAYGIIAPCFGLEKSDCFEDRKFDQAKRLFDEALLEEGITLEMFPVLTIRYSTGSETMSRISQTVQQIWEKTFGIKVTLHQSDWPVHFTALQNGDYEIGMMSWFSSIEDPIDILQTFKYKHDRVNMSNWESQEYLDLIEVSNYETNPKKRNCLLTAAEKILMDEMPIIPIYYVGMEFSKKTELTGVNLPPTGGIDFKFASFSQ
ncbi:MAG: peptide ABC transporter substrate-binding protein [Candidatus Neptunochlamydia sp.]|nr:peptide ABC transporter substrate-binding protein [Candidatus Neptunochlamydia sp.]